VEVVVRLGAAVDVKGLFAEAVVVGEGLEPVAVLVKGEAFVVRFVAVVDVLGRVDADRAVEALPISLGFAVPLVVAVRRPVLIREAAGREAAASAGFVVAVERDIVVVLTDDLLVNVDDEAVDVDLAVDVASREVVVVVLTLEVVVGVARVVNLEANGALETADEVVLRTVEDTPVLGADTDGLVAADTPGLVSGALLLKPVLVLEVVVGAAVLEAGTRAVVGLVVSAVFAAAVGRDKAVLLVVEVAATFEAAGLAPAVVDGLEATFEDVDKGLTLDVTPVRVLDLAAIPVAVLAATPDGDDLVATVDLDATAARAVAVVAGLEA